MTNTEGRIETRQDTAAKIAEKMGLDQPSAFDLVDRSKYDDDESYLDAVIKADMELNSPEYQAARRRLKAEYKKRREAEEKERIEHERTVREAQFADIRAATELTSTDQKEIDMQAVAMARRDLADGKIAASGLGSSIEQYAKELADDRKDSKASAQLFNSMFRDILRDQLRGRR